MGVFKNEVGRPTNKTLQIRNILKAIVIIIVGMMLIAVGYFLKDYEKTGDNNKKNTLATKKNFSEELDIKSKEVMNLYLPFSYFTYNASDEELYKKDKVTADDLSSEYKNRLAFAHYYNTVGFKNEFSYKYTYDEYNSKVYHLSSKELEKYYKELFGENDIYVAKSFLTDVIFIGGLSHSEYNNKEKTYYITDENSVGDISLACYRYDNELYKAIKLKNKIELYEYVVVYNADFINNKAGVYKNINDADNFKNAINEVDLTDYNSLVTLHSNDYQDQASQYKLTFELENNNYVFKSAEKIK